MPFRLAELIRRNEESQPPCVSIYLPGVRAGRETRQGPSRMKNALREARTQATDMGVDKRVIDEVLAPATALVEDDDFWQHQDDGLAVLLSPNVQEILRLPREFAELVVVSDRFHLKPLVPLDDDLDFLLLALSQNEVKLYSGTRAGLELLPATELPKSLAAALWMDDPEQSLQFHSYSTPNAMRAMFHGQGGGQNDEDKKKELTRYFRAVDDGLREYVGDDHRPLLLACVDYYLPIYQDASEYPHLVDEAVSGNADERSAEELHRAAWSILSTRLEREHERARAAYEELAGTGRTSDALEDVVRAAQNGRVQDLFVALDRHCWGRPSPDGAQPPEVHAEREPGDVDLLDFTAVATLARGGDVHALADGEFVGRGAVAATLRY